MRGLAPDVIAQFEKVWHDKSLNHEAKRTQFRALAKKLLNKQQLEDYDKFEARTDERHKSFEAKVSVQDASLGYLLFQLNALSPEARTAFDAIHKLKQNERSILSELPDPARREILQLPATGPGHDLDNDGTPNFLEKADPKVQTKFRTVWFNTAMDPTTKKAELKKLADSELTAEQKDMFTKHFADIDAAHTKLQAAVSDVENNVKVHY